MDGPEKRAADAAGIVCYRIGTSLEPVAEEALRRPGRGLAVILASDEKRALPAGVMPPSPRGARVSRAEGRRDCLCGAMALPGRAPFGYSVAADAVVFLDSGGTVRPCLKQMEKEKTWREPGLGVFLCDLWELLLAGDIRSLEELEERIAKLENAVLSGTAGDFHRRLMAVRREVMAYARCYTQLGDVLYKFLENGNGYFGAEDLRLFQLFRERVGRLASEAENLREHCLQVWELFQAELDLRQNRIMKVLTIVTTVFLPLTLLVGWYGMNFRGMPELSWAYGYPAMILASVLVVGLTVWLLKKKKLW